MPHLDSEATCREASIHSGSVYLPCGRPATELIELDGAQVPMCESCARHNVKNRGGKRIDQKGSTQNMRLPLTKSEVEKKFQSLSGQIRKLKRERDELVREAAPLYAPAKPGDAVVFQNYAGKTIRDVVKSVEPRKPKDHDARPVYDYRFESGYSTINSGISTDNVELIKPHFEG